MTNNMGDIKTSKTIGKRVSDSYLPTSINWTAQSSIGNRTTAVRTTIHINSSKTIIKNSNVNWWRNTHSHK